MWPTHRWGCREWAGKNGSFLSEVVSIWETPCFCFSLQEWEGRGTRGCKMVAHWLKLPLDDVYGALSCSWAHCTQRTLFSNHPVARTPLPTLKTPPSPFLAADPHLLPVLCFPWPLSKCFMWPRQVEGGPPPLSSQDTCFPVGPGCVAVGRVEQSTGGVQWTGRGERTAPWERRK